MEWRRRSKGWPALKRNLIGAAQKIAQFPVAPILQSGSGQGDQVDLSTEAVALIQSRNSFEANTKVIQIADEMDKTLLNAVG